MLIIYRQIIQGVKMDITLLYLLIILFFMATWLFITLAIYFTPVIIAFVRRHNNTFAITIMTLFVGWTFFGWLAALLWSLNSDTKKEVEEN